MFLFVKAGSLLAFVVEEDGAIHLSRQMCSTDQSHSLVFKYLKTIFSVVFSENGAWLQVLTYRNISFFQFALKHFWNSELC